MKTKTTVDFHRVEEKHQAIHERLENWSRWVSVRFPSWVSPMFRLYQSKARQWHEPEFRPTCDLLDAAAMEKAVYHLPAVHREAMRWFYVHRYGELKFRREHGLTQDRLIEVLRDARQMLSNRISG